MILFYFIQRKLASQQKFKCWRFVSYWFVVIGSVVAMKTDTAKKHEHSENPKTEHDFDLQLNLPLCLTHVNVFDPSDNLNEMGGKAREKKRPSPSY